MTKMVRRSLALALAVAPLVASAALAQPQLTAPRPSPGASVSQWVGLTEVTVRYSRPGVKERKIWGGLVPYGEVWRTGANENTTITFSTAAKVGGQEIPAGTYGLQTIPTEGDWTVILSKDADLWGAFNYKPENDALRVTVKPEAASHEERMSFSFDDSTETTAKLVLRWEKVSVPIMIESDTAARMGEKVRWNAAYQAANWCLQSGSCVDQGIKYVESSIALDSNFYNQRTKANLLAKKGDVKGAIAAGEAALTAAKAAKQAPPAADVSALDKLVAEWKAKG